MINGLNPCGFNGYLAWRERRAKEEDELCLKQAIEDFKIKTLSGGTALTDEEKEKIREIISQWLEQNPLETEDDKAAFKAFLKQLYIEFGAKDFLLDVVLAKLGDKLDTSDSLKLMADIRANLIFGGTGADPVPTRLLPLKFQLQNEDPDQ